MTVNTQDAIVVRNSLFVGKSEGIKQIPNGVPTTVDCTTGVEASEDGAKSDGSGINLGLWEVYDTIITAVVVGKLDHNNRWRTAV